MKEYKMYIGGQWVSSSNNETFESVNPYTGKPWARIPRATVQDADRAAEAANSAFKSSEWSKLTATQRGHLLRRLGDLIAENADQLAQVEVTDNGKLINEMSFQMKYLPQWYYYFGGLADKIQGAVIPIDKPDTFNFTTHEPLGVCLGITPWNSPLLILAYKLAPALAAGNTFIAKPSEFTSASTLEFAKLVERAGFPPGVFNVVTGFGSEVGEALISHSRVAKIAFTGSETSGRHIAEVAARNFKRVTLELGGKSPNIVFSDAELENAVKGVISGIFAASGQTCIAGSRLLVQRSIYDQFIERVVKHAGAARMGDPMHSATQVGPVTTQPQFKKILDYIDIGKREGANCLMGGGAASRPECGDGWFVEPTIFSGVNNQMRIAREEIFGPVLSCIPFDDEDEALEIANDSPFGLASGVWTQDMRRVMRMSKGLQAGTVWVNTYRVISFMSPLGGYKNSGIGRENGVDSILAYMQTKSVMISSALDVPDPFVMR